MMKNKKHTACSYDVVDTELTCSACHQHLYVPTAAFNEVFAFVARGGAGLLLCICGHRNLVYPIPPQWAEVLREQSRN